MGGATVNYGFEARGNTVTRNGLTGGDETLAWDSNNRLRAVTKSSGGAWCSLRCRILVGGVLLCGGEFDHCLSFGWDGSVVILMTVARRWLSGITVLVVARWGIVMVLVLRR